IAARATPRRMTAVEVIDLTAGSLRDLPSGRAMVETMMLPETGTVVVPHRLALALALASAPAPSPSLAEAMTDSDALPEAKAEAKAKAEAEAKATAGSALAAAGVSRAVPLNGAIDAGPLVPAAALVTVAPPSAAIRDDDPSAQAAQPSKQKRGRRGK